VTLFVVDLLPLFVASGRGWTISRCDVRKHTSDPSRPYAAPHLQCVVRATDSAITHVHGLPLAAPPTPAWENLTTDNYKIPTTNNVVNDSPQRPTSFKRTDTRATHHGQERRPPLKGRIHLRRLVFSTKLPLAVARRTIHSWQLSCPDECVS
jgi:hypothetical protein